MAASPAVDLWDAAAADYGRQLDRTPANALKVDLLRRHVRASDRVLDVGCANGVHLTLSARLCAGACGVDIAPAMVERARERLAVEEISNAKVMHGSATRLPFGDTEFDLAYSYSTLVLVDNLDVALAEIARVVRPGGTVLLDFTGRRNLQGRHWRRWYARQGVSSWNALTLGELRSDLSALGFEITELHGLGLLDQWKFVRPLNRVRFLDSLFHREGLRDLDYFASNAGPLQRAANRWYVAARKR